MLGITTVLLTLSLHCQAANILAVIPLPVLSHHMFFKPILQELAVRGHNVTVVTMLPNAEAKYKQIIVKNPIEKHTDENAFLEMRNIYWFTEFISVSYFSTAVGHITFQHPEVQNLIHSTNISFDGVLVEAMFVQEAYVAFGHKFNAPIIVLSSLCTGFWFNELTRNPNHYSYIVDYKTLSSNKMSFYERLENTIRGLSVSMFYRYMFLPGQQALADQYMTYPGWETRPPLIEMLPYISLFVGNTHLAMHYPQPNNPNVVYAGGIHIKPPKQLPQDLQEFLDNSEEGVIYFSLGNNIKSSTLPEGIKAAFISAFAKVPYKVLWKWESDSLAGQPNNVKVLKWLPQSDVLNHSNIKAFISHGGLFSLTESIHRGVPLIVIPIFGDQPKNSIQIQSAGSGLILDFDNITEASVIWAINEITLPKYKNAALRQSAVLRDNPMSPMDSAMFWIEYVIRHRGAAHLQTAALELSWSQYYLLDVIAAILAITFIIIVIVYFILKAICRYLCGKIADKFVQTPKKTN